MFSVYCLFIYFLFLCCKYRPFFPIFFYIIPTKICKILFFCKKHLFSPSFSSLFLHLSLLSFSSIFPFFPSFLFPFPFCIQLVGFGAARLHRFPSSLVSLTTPSSLIAPLSFGEGLGVRLPKKRPAGIILIQMRLQASHIHLYQE